MSFSTMLSGHRILTSGAKRVHQPPMVAFLKCASLSYNVLRSSQAKPNHTLKSAPSWTPPSRIPCQSAYSTFTPPDNPPPTPTPEMYLQVLETTVSAPWVALEHTSSDHATLEDRLKRAYGRVFQIFMYLARPQEEEVAAKFLDDFEKAPLEEGSDIARARAAISVLIDTIVRDVDSIPLSSPLRTEHREIFDIFGAIVPLYDVFKAEDHGIGQPAWAEFWSKGQYILVTLGQKLDECGFGLKEGE